MLIIVEFTYDLILFSLCSAVPRKKFSVILFILIYKSRICKTVFESKIVDKTIKIEMPYDQNSTIAIIKKPLSGCFPCITQARYLWKFISVSDIPSKLPDNFIRR